MKQVGLLGLFFGLLVNICLGSQFDGVESNRLDEPPPLPSITDQSPSPLDLEKLITALLTEDQKMLINETKNTPLSPNVRKGRISGLVNLNINYDVPPPYDQAQGWLDLFERVANFFSKPDKLCSADSQVIFMSKNGCRGKQVGSSKPHNFHGGWSSQHRWNMAMENVKKKSCFDNDDARSALILPGLKQNSYIFLADHPTESWKDDRTLIRILKDLPANKPYCVDGFEFGYADEWVNLYHWHKNGLDGKVSRVGVWNPKATPAPKYAHPYCYPPGWCVDKFEGTCKIYADYGLCSHTSVGSFVRDYCAYSCRIC